jgi:hypothetical protein
LAHLVRRLLSRIDVFHVVTESDSTEDKSENYAHETNITQLDYVETDGFEDVSDFRDVAEDVHDVQEVYGRVEESPEESHQHVDQHSIELACLIQWLRGITSLHGLVNQLQSDIDLQFAGYALYHVFEHQHILVRSFFCIFRRL